MISRHICRQWFSVSTWLPVRQVCYRSTWEEPVLKQLWMEKASFNQLYKRFWINSLNFSLSVYEVPLSRGNVFLHSSPRILQSLPVLWYDWHAQPSIPNSPMQGLDCPSPRASSLYNPDILVNCHLFTFALLAAAPGSLSPLAFPLLPPPMAQSCVHSDIWVSLYFMLAVSRYWKTLSFLFLLPCLPQPSWTLTLWNHKTFYKKSFISCLSHNAL